MSAKFFSSSHPASRHLTQKEQDDQVSALYELGLLGSSSRGPGRREKGKDRDLPGGSSVPERYPNKSKSAPFMEKVPSEPYPYPAAS